MTPDFVSGILQMNEKNCSKMNSKVNEEKSKVVVFKNGHKMKKWEKFNFYGKPLEIVEKFNYLGLTLNWNGKCTEHVKKP